MGDWADSSTGNPGAADTHETRRTAGREKAGQARARAAQLETELGRLRLLLTRVRTATRGIALQHVSQRRKAGILPSAPCPCNTCQAYRIAAEDASMVEVLGVDAALGETKTPDG